MPVAAQEPIPGATAWCLSTTCGPPPSFQPCHPHNLRLAPGNLGILFIMQGLYTAMPPLDSNLLLQPSHHSLSAAGLLLCFLTNRWLRRNLGSMLRVGVREAGSKERGREDTRPRIR